MQNYNGPPNDAAAGHWRLLLPVGVVGFGCAYVARHTAAHTWLAAAVLFMLAVISSAVSWSLRSRRVGRHEPASLAASADVPKWDWRSNWTWDSLSCALNVAATLLVVLGQF